MHQVQVLKPGLHGIESITVRCACARWGVTTWRSDRVDGLRREHDAHAASEAELDAYSTALHRLPPAPLNPRTHTGVSRGGVKAHLDERSTIQVSAVDTDGAVWMWTGGIRPGSKRRRSWSVAP